MPFIYTLKVCLNTVVFRAKFSTHELGRYIQPTAGLQWVMRQRPDQRKWDGRRAKIQRPCCLILENHIFVLTSEMHMHALPMPHTTLFSFNEQGITILLLSIH